MANYKYFHYFQPNPDKTKEKGDCAIRTLCAATDKDWLTIYDKLTAIGREIYDVPISMDAIAIFLENENFTPYKISLKKGQKRPTMQTLIKKYPRKIIVGRSTHHISCARNGKVMDLWDSSSRPLYKYWLKNEN